MAMKSVSDAALASGAPCSPDATEGWLLRLWEDRGDPLARMRLGTTWYDALQFALRRLSQARDANKHQYYYGVSRPEAHPVHQEFWDRMERTFELLGVVTTNYDILAERALHEHVAGQSKPRFYYGGFQYHQIVKKMVDVSARGSAKSIDFPLGTTIPIYKLHGSLNWAWEPHSQTLKIHDDVRAIFRKEGAGIPAVIPPIPEKQMPEDFSQIWAEAHRTLTAADVWVVCGYSLPEYDVALRGFFESAQRASDVRCVLVCAPNSADLLDRWTRPNRRGVLPEVRALPGLPDASSLPWV